MEISQLCWTPNAGWEKPATSAPEAQLVLVFSDSDYFRQPACYEDLRRMFPVAHIVGCSSSGNVHGTKISDDDIVVTAIRFAKGRVRLMHTQITLNQNLQTTAAQLMSELKTADLQHAFALSDGLTVNGSDFASGLNLAGIPVTGGLAGDGTHFSSTWVMANAPAAQNLIAVIGFYGDIKVKSGCAAGWREFGAERLVSRSIGNVVYEIDQQPALEIYAKYLGDMAKDLPSSGLRFPLSIRANEKEKPLIRTLLAVDATTQSLTFAGDVPQGHYCRLMKTDLDSLIDASGIAANEAKSETMGRSSLCLVVSCVGRRLVLGQLTEEELDILHERLGPDTVISGFYSYGELAPFRDIAKCELHNQTMTITTLIE
jgi:hypothetical protein